MDAFTPRYLGRCVVAKKDSQQLLENININSELIPMINYMYARALFSCEQVTQAKKIMAQLLQENEASKKIARYSFTSVPPWLSIETVSYTHLRAHETGRNLVCRLLLEKKKKNKKKKTLIEKKNTKPNTVQT